MTTMGAGRTVSHAQLWTLWMFAGGDVARLAVELLSNVPEFLRISTALSAVISRHCSELRLGEQKLRVHSPDLVDDFWKRACDFLAIIQCSQRLQAIALRLAGDAAGGRTGLPHDETTICVRRRG